KRHTLFDKPAGQQAALPERRPAVAVADRVLLLVQIERLEPGAQDYLRGVGIKPLMLFDALLAARLGEIVFEVLEQVEPPAKPLGIDATGQLHVTRQLIGIGDDEWRHAHAEEPGADGAGTVADADEVRQIEIIVA